MQEYKYSADTDIESVSTILMENLDKVAEVVYPDVDLFRKIEEADHLPQLLGGLANDLQSFIKSINCNHHNLSLALNGSFNKGSQFSSYLQECCDYAQCNAKTPILNTLIKEYLYKQEGILPLSYFIKKPPISLLKDSETRKQCRNYFNEHNYIFNDDEECGNYFNLLANSFIPYVKGGEGFKKEIEQNIQTISMLNDLGLISQSQTLKRYNNELFNTVQDTYLGFVRILMSHASTIIAKKLGGYFKSNKIYLPNNLNKLGFAIEANDLVYQPTIYPINKLPFELPNFSKNLFEKLENYQPINGLPIFDNYWIVMPSIELPEKNDKVYFRHEFKDYEGDIKTTKNELNKILFSKGFTPILLGESKITDKCYFISYVV